MTKGGVGRVAGREEPLTWLIEPSLEPIEDVRLVMGLEEADEPVGELAQ